MAEKYILFDFDGTVGDSSEGVFTCVIHAFEKMGMAIPDAAELRRFIGPPLMESFMTRHNLSEAEAERAVAYYRELYSESGLLLCRAYDGIEGLLRRLKEQGFILAVATSKPEVYARKILKNMGLDSYFTFIAGAEFKGKRTDKINVLAYCLENLGIDPSEAIMIGDRYHDVEGAKNFGMRSIYVLWGFGNREEAEKYGADFICQDTEELYITLTGE